MAAPVNPYGEITVKIPSGTVPKGQPPEKTYVIMSFDQPDMTEPQSVRSGDKQDNMDWKCSKDFVCKAAISRGNNMVVQLMQHRILGSDQPLGTAKVPLDSLELGQSVGPQDVDVKNVKGETIATVNVSVVWKDGMVPEFAQGAGGAAASSLARPLGGKPGEKAIPLPDPEGQDYGVRVKIHRLKGLQNLDPEKLYAPRCMVQAANKTYKTETAHGNDVSLDEECGFTFQKVAKNFFSEVLAINVLHNRFGLPDEKIGLVELDFGSIYRANRTHALLRKWFVILRAPGEGTVMGYAKMSIAVTNLRNDPLVEFDEDGQVDNDEKDEDITANLVSVSGAAFEEIFLHMDVVKGEGMPKMDAGAAGKCDPYVKVHFGKASVETCLAKDDMELLTYTGFVGYAEAKRRYDAGELLVAGYDQDTRGLVYETPSHFIDKNGAPDDGMYEIKERVTHGGVDKWDVSTGFSVKFTGNHQVLMEGAKELPWVETTNNRCRFQGLGPVKPTIHQLLGNQLQPNGQKWPSGLKQARLWGAKPRRPLGDDSLLYHTPAAVNGLEDGVRLRDVVPIAELAPAWCDAPEAPDRLAGARHERRPSADKEDIERALCELLGFWLGDGSFDAHRTTMAYVLFAQVKNSDVVYLTERFDRIGLKREQDYSCHVVDRTDGRRLTIWRVSRPSWRLFFAKEFACKYVNGLAVARNLGVETDAVRAWRREYNCDPPTDAQIRNRAIEERGGDEIVIEDNNNSEPPLGTPSMGRKSGVAAATTSVIHIIRSVKWFWIWVWRLRRTHALYLLAGLAEADGHSDKDNDVHSNVVYTSSVAFRDQIGHLALHAGRTTKYLRIYTKDTVRGHHDDGTPIIAKHDHWRVSFSIPVRRASPAFSRKDIVKVEGYNHGVWCVTMPRTGNIVVRRRHADPAKSYRPVITSNCHINDTYTPIWDTRLQLSVMLPCLASSLKIELWDYDAASKDDIIATLLLNINDLMSGRKDNLPLLATRYINFYGHPRAKDADWNRYYKQMARGTKKGVDFRGRVLMRIQGARSKIMPAMPSYRESTVTLEVFVEVMQLSQLPTKDKFKIKAFVGTTSGSTQFHQSDKMIGEGIDGHALYMGERITFTVGVPVVIPNRDELVAAQIDEGDHFEDHDPVSMTSFTDTSLASNDDVVRAVEKVIWEQIPALVIHLITDSAVNSLLDKVTGAIDEEPTAAVVFQPQRFFQAGGSFHCSKAMRMMTDPEKNKAGKEPANPLLQINAGMLLRRVLPEPEVPLNVNTSAPKYLATTGRMHSFILSVFVYHARNVPAGDDNGLSDPYLVVTWCNAGGKTGVKKETLNPSWNEAIYIDAMTKDPLPDLTIELWDWDWIGSDTFLCKSYLSLTSVKSSKPFWVTKFTDSFGHSCPGTEVLIGMTLEPATEEKRKALQNSIKRVPMRMHRDSSRTYKGYPIPTANSLSMAQYSFNSRIFSLRQMRKYHLKDVTAPQIEFECLAKDDMELLTDTGFIGYAEARRRYDNNSLIVAGYDQKARCLVYETPTNFIDKDGVPDDGMYEIKERVVEQSATDCNPEGAVFGTGYSLKVTGNHQILMQVDAETPWGRANTVLEGGRQKTHNKIADLGPLKPSVKQILGVDRIMAKKTMTSAPALAKWPSGLKSVDDQGRPVKLAEPRQALTDGDDLYLMATAVNGLRGVSLRDCVNMPLLAPAWPGANNLAGRHDPANKVTTKSQRAAAAAAAQVQQEDAMCELLGFWLGDGSLTNSGAAVTFNQTKDGDVDYIQKRLDLLGMQREQDYTRIENDATASHTKSTLFRITRRSWLELFYGEFACKYTGGLEAAAELGVDASAKAAWCREFNTDPPTDEQIKLRAIAECNDIIIINDVNVNRPLGTSSMSLKDGGADSTSTTTTTDTITCNIKSAKWFWVWVWKLGRDHALAIARGLFEADGCGGRDDDNESNNVFTSSVHFRDACVRLAVHAGRSAKVFLMRAVGDVLPATEATHGRDIICRHDQWSVSFSIPQGPAASPIFCRKDIVEVEGYDKGVWCVTMPSGNIVVRRRHSDPTMFNRPVIIGNCYDNVAQSMRKQGKNADFDQELNWTLTLPAVEDYLPFCNVYVYDYRLGLRVLVAIAQINLTDPLLNLQVKRQNQLKDSEAVKLHLSEALMAEKRMAERELDSSAASTGMANTPGKDDPPDSHAKLSVVAKSVSAFGGMKLSSSSSASAASPATAAAAPIAPNEPIGADDKAEHPEEGHEMDNKNASGAEQQSETNNNNNNKDAPGARPKLAPHVMAAQELDARIKSAVEEEAQELADPASETQSTVSTEPDELMWFDRFDPASADDSTGGALGIPYEKRVARFGKIAPKCRSLGLGKTQVEDVFGPFNDMYTALPLQRGWGAANTKAGVLNIDMSFQKLSVNSSTAGGAAAAAAAQLQQQQQVSNDKRKTEVRWKVCDARKRTPFLCRVYIINCRDLTAMDTGIMGNSSDPYVVMKLCSGGFEEKGAKDVVVNCKDQLRYQVLDPDFYFMRELSGELPLHSQLRIIVMDWDRIGRDELIGYTDIDLEERYYSARGHRMPRLEPDPLRPPEMQDAAAFYGLNHYGSYTEKRLLRNESGLTSGMIELWVDLFDFSSPIPRPIDIAPPPPIPFEMRAIIWNVRDCELTDEAITGELMTDIYVQAWVDSMDSDKQNTDTHYRSLDGTGSFNWRMNYTFVFDPRLKKVFPAGDLTETEGGLSTESGGAASTATKKFFGVRKEAKKMKPRFRVQLWDNDLFPGTDDYIGEANLNLLNLVPAFGRRAAGSLFHDVTNDCLHCTQRFPWNMCCVCECCKPDKGTDQMSLKERQEYARKEMRKEREARNAKFEAEADLKFRQLADYFPPEEHEKIKARLIKSAKKAAKVNVFKDFLPQRSKKSQKMADDQLHNEVMQKKMAAVAAGTEDPTNLANKAEEAAQGPVVAELPRQWYICRSPSGGIRIGDVQMSFQLVRLDALHKDEKLQAGKGRSEPQQLPEPDRPDSSFFWLSSPFKSALHILWKNYKWHFCCLICTGLIVLAAVIFFNEGLATKARTLFGGSIY